MIENNKWEKIGRILTPRVDRYWSQSFMSLPTVMIYEEHVRIYYGSRDNLNRSRIGYVDYDIMNQRMAKLNPMGRNIQTPVELEIKANLYNLPNSKKKFKDVYYEKIQQLSPLPNVANTSIDPYKNAFLNINPIDSRNTDQ